MRSFALQVPVTAGDAFRWIDVVAPASMDVPRLLHLDGLAGYAPHPVGCFLAALERCRPGKVIDVGAGLGVFSWLAAAVGGRDVVAFETERAELAANTARANDLAIVVERSVTEVDAYCERTDTNVAVLRVDSEAELDALRGAHQVIQRDRPWIISKVHPALAENELMELFEPLGYHWFLITDEGALVPRKEIFGDRSLTHLDWLFAPEALDDDFWNRAQHWRKQVAQCGVRTAAETRESLSVPGLAFEAGWRPMERRRFGVVCDGDRARIQTSLVSKERVYFLHGDRDLDQPEDPESRIPVAVGAEFEVECEVEGDRANMPGVHLLAYQFDDASRLSSKRAWLEPGINVLRFQAHPDAQSFRLAFRFSGAGELTVLPLRCYRLVG